MGEECGAAATFQVGGLVRVICLVRIVYDRIEY
jgi:hypothetical protein